MLVRTKMPEEAGLLQIWRLKLALYIPHVKHISLNLKGRGRRAYCKFGVLLRGMAISFP